MQRRSDQVAEEEDLWKITDSNLTPEAPDTLPQDQNIYYIVAITISGPEVSVMNSVGPSFGSPNSDSVSLPTDDLQLTKYAKTAPVASGSEGTAGPQTGPERTARPQTGSERTARPQTGSERADSPQIGNSTRSSSLSRSLKKTPELWKKLLVAVLSVIAVSVMVAGIVIACTGNGESHTGPQYTGLCL